MCPLLSGRHVRKDKEQTWQVSSLWALESRDPTTLRYSLPLLGLTGRWGFSEKAVGSAYWNVCFEVFLIVTFDTQRSVNIGIKVCNTNFRIRDEANLRDLRRRSNSTGTRSFKSPSGLRILAPHTRQIQGMAWQLLRPPLDHANSCRAEVDNNTGLRNQSGNRWGFRVQGNTGMDGLKFYQGVRTPEVVPCSSA